MENKQVTTVDLHGFHPYPCKFPDSTARKHLSSGVVVLDPYCGSGTTLLEAAIAGHDVIGMDCNPIALVITKAKMLNANLKLRAVIDELVGALNKAATRADSLSYDLPDFAGRNHWFSETARREFGMIRHRLNQMPRESDEWTAAAAVASSIVTKYSNQDSETRYARVERELRPGAVLDAYTQRLQHFLKCLEKRGNLCASQRIFEEDFGIQIQVEDETVDQIITSPPYANTMDYYLYHKQRMNVLGYDFKIAQAREIGSRHEFSSQKQKVSKWNSDLLAGLQQCFRVLRKGGTAIYIIGDSQIAGKKLDAGKLVCQLAHEVGFKATILQSEPMTGKSRLFAKAFQAPNKFEHTIRMLK